MDVKKMETKEMANTRRRILVVVLSTLVPSEMPLASGRRSVFSPAQRCEQTIETVRSVRKYLPDATIFVCDNSKHLLKDSQLKLKDAGAHHFYHQYAKQFSDSLWKAQTEAACGLIALQYLISQDLLRRFDMILKISGRYCLNENFQLDRFTTPKCFSFWKSKTIADSISTVVYSFDVALVDAWRSIMMRMLKRPSWDGFETILYKETRWVAHYIDVVGAGGYVSIDGTFWIR